jgi:hypothetical protein
MIVNYPCCKEGAIYLHTNCTRLCEKYTFVEEMGRSGTHICKSAVDNGIYSTQEHVQRNISANKNWRCVGFKCKFPKTFEVE